MLAVDYPFLDLMWTMLVFFLWVAWFMLLFRVFGDIFRRHDLSGWGKTGWIIFTIVLPFLGVFIYLIARGGKMHERQIADATAQQKAFDQYVQQTAGAGDVAGQLEKLAGLRDQGVISAEEFEAQKAKLLA